MIMRLLVLGDSKFMATLYIYMVKNTALVKDTTRSCPEFYHGQVDVEM